MDKNYSNFNFYNLKKTCLYFIHLLGLNSISLEKDWLNLEIASLKSIIVFLTDRCQIGSHKLLCYVQLFVDDICRYS